jgi:hypothetical protein
MSTDLSGRLFERVGNHLVPADLYAHEFVEKLKNGQKLLVDAKTPRSPENHAHFYAILRAALEHLEGFADEDALLDSLKMATGHVRQIMLVDGTMVFIPKSIRFAAMGEDAFKRFKERALYVLTQLLGFDAATLATRVRQDSRRNRQLDDRNVMDAEFTTVSHGDLPPSTTRLLPPPRR